MASKLRDGRARRVWLVGFVVALGVSAPAFADPIVQSPEGVGRTGPEAMPPATPTALPLCIPVDCQGVVRPASYDATGDCKVTIADSDTVMRFLNSRSPSSRVTTQSAHLDANQDGWVDPRDSLVIVDALNESGCLGQPPTSTATPTSRATPTSTATLTSSPSATVTATPTQTPSQTAAYAGKTVPDCNGKPLPDRWDVNKDGVFNDGDRRWAATYLKLVGDKNSESYDSHFDVSGDGKLSSVDVSLLSDLVSQTGCFPPTPTPTSTPLPTRTATITPTLFVPPTWTPTPAPCPFNSFETLVIGRNGKADNLIPTTYGASLACLRQAVEISRGGCRIYGKAEVFDDCVQENFGRIFGPGQTVGANTWHQVFYFDQQCKPVTQIPAGVEVCDAGRYEWLLSPVSLIWNEGASGLTSSSIVDFPIDPAGTGRVYRWYASAEKPLLVWDPEHRGVVRDGTQLFGHWTFGGPRMASLDTGAARSVSVRWRNGFEALASLDTNGDGEVSGPELAPLALWFDVNRDGVSQPGEVRAVTREGVTKLFYTVDHSENEGRHLYASRGFERVTKEGRKLGRAVDWFAEGDTNRMLLAQKLISQPSVLGGEAADSVVRQLKEDLMTRVVSDGDAEVYASTQADPDLRGLWEWQIETTDDSKRNGFEPKGYLGFSTESDGRISGYSVVELPFMDGHPTKSMARAYIIEGRRTSKDQFSFDLQMPTSTSTKLHNTVKRISPHRLEGRTTVTVLEKGGTATVDYTWTAQQVLRK